MLELIEKLKKHDNKTDRKLEQIKHSANHAYKR